MKIELPLLFLEFPHPFTFLFVVYSSVHDLSPEVFIVKGTKIGKGGVRANHIPGMCMLTDCVCEHCFLFVCFVVVWAAGRHSHLKGCSSCVRSPLEAIAPL